MNLSEYTWPRPPGFTPFEHQKTTSEFLTTNRKAFCFNEQGTFGRLLFGDNTLHTIELPWRENQRRVSCIPTGVYQCALVNSPRFGRVYEVRNVPGRDHILIHASNLAGDVNKGWVTQLHGCIAPCERLGAIKIPDGRMQKAGLVSRPALRKLMDWAGGKNFTLEVIC